MKTIKTVFIGDISVGKTWLIATYLTNETPSGYVSTVFDNFGTVGKYKDQEVLLSIFDTAGTSEWNKTNVISYQQTDVFVVCFSVNNVTSFNNATRFLDRLKIYGVPVILCATKTDLKDDRVIDGKVAQNVSEKFGCYDYVETSAVEFSEISKLFDTVLEAALEPKEYRKTTCKNIFFCCK
ncbi:hypothetical protein P3W45_001716 [Vairimorpha bombi]|jgi:cell division control protein 42